MTRIEERDPTFAEDIEYEANGEAIEAIIVGEKGYGKQRGIGAEPEYNKLTTWEKVGPFLNYNYNRGFGGIDCHPIYAWTATKIIYVSQYDGSTSVESIPRNPIDCEPGMPGG